MNYLKINLNLKKISAYHTIIEIQRISEMNNENEQKTYIDTDAFQLLLKASSINRHLLSNLTKLLLMNNSIFSPQFEQLQFMIHF